MDLPVNYEELSPRERREVRLEYIRLQDNLCYYCESNINMLPPKEITKKKINLNLFPKGFLDHPIHLHHNHESGMTIGAVHSYCNAVLWQYDRE